MITMMLLPGDTLQLRRSCLGGDEFILFDQYGGIKRFAEERSEKPILRHHECVEFYHRDDDVICICVVVDEIQSVIWAGCNENPWPIIQALLEDFRNANT